MRTEKKRIIPTEFLWAFFCTAIGLAVYILGRKIIPFPEKWMGASLHKSLFFLGIFNHLTANWILNLFFILLDQEKYGYEKIKKLRNNLSRALTLILFIGFGVFTYWKSIGGNWANISFLILILAIINCCIDAIIQFINKYGICNGFSLLLFIEFLPSKWLAEVFWPNIVSNYQSGNWLVNLGKQPWFCVLILLAITIFFVWLINAKWEAPVETNSAYFANNNLVQKNHFPLGFKMNFNFMHLFQLSQALGWIHVLIKLIKLGGSSLSEIFRNYQIVNVGLQVDSIIWQGNGENVGEKFLLLSNKRRLFDGLFTWLKYWKWQILLALLVLLFLRWFSTWLTIRKFSPLKTKEISERLQKSGIYINNVPSGQWTRNLLKKVVNRLVLYWILTIILFNIIFDQIFANLEEEKINSLRELGKSEQGKAIIPSLLGSREYTFFTSFIDWFGSVGIGVGLYQEIKTKYKYIQRK